MVVKNTNLIKYGSVEPEVLEMMAILAVCCTVVNRGGLPQADRAGRPPAGGRVTAARGRAGLGRLEPGPDSF